MKKILLSAAILAAAMAVSCSKNDSSTTMEREARLTVMTGSYGETKALELPTTEDTDASYDDSSLMIDGKIINKEGSGSDVSYVFKIASSTTVVGVQANYDGMTVNGVELSSNVNSRQGILASNVVMLTGDAIIKSDDSATATLTPEMARIQIIDDVVGSTDFEISDNPLFHTIVIEGIYLDNFFLDREASELNNSATGSADVPAAYASGQAKEKMYDVLNINIMNETGELSDLVRNGNLFGDTNDVANAVAYNIFPQSVAMTSNEDASVDSPHIVVRFSAYDTEHDKNVTKHLRVRAYLDGAGYISFEAGNIYSVNMSEILQLIFDGNGDDEFNQNKKFVTLKVTIAEWTHNNVTPEL